MILDVKGLSFEYDKNDVLNDISFSLEKGTYTCIIGENGSGKTTLVKLLAGLLEPTKGKIEGEKCEIGLVFQNPDNQFVNEIVRHDIAFGLENKVIPQEDMDTIIDRVTQSMGISDLVDCKISELSGGQKQRVAIAGMIAMSNNLIILDESTSMLDPKSKMKFLNYIKAIEGLTIISVTHDMDEAAGADMVICLNDGKLCKKGTPREVFYSEELYDANLKPDVVAFVQKSSIKKQLLTLEDLEEFYVNSN